MKKIGFVGCGEWARKKYLPYLVGRDDVALAGISNIVSIDEKRKISESIGATSYYDSVEDLLDAEHVDGIIISLPHALHYEAIKHSLLHSVSCLVDKPLCTNSVDAKKLVELAEKKSLGLAVCSQRRTMRGNTELKRAIDTTTIGLPRWFRAEFHISSYPNWHKSWRNNPELSGEPTKGQGIILDTGYHSIDAIQQFMNFELPAKVFALATNREFEVDTEAEIIMTYQSGVHVSISLSRGMPSGESRESISILGSNGFGGYSINEHLGKKSAVYSLSNSNGTSVSSEFASDTSLDPLVNFISYLNGGNINENWQAKTTISTLKVIDAIYESISQGELVELGPKNSI